MNTPKNSLPDPGDKSTQVGSKAEVASAGQPASAVPAPPRVVRSEEILQGDPEVQITHLDKVYRLRRTRNGKLILQK